MDILISRIIFTILWVGALYFIWTQPVSIKKLYERFIPKTSDALTEKPQPAIVQVVTGNNNIVSSGNIINPVVQTDTFSIADCTFDALFKFPKNTIQTYRQAFPNEIGSFTAIVEIYKNAVPNQYIRLHLSGTWQGTTGIIPVLQEDLITFNLSAEEVALYRKKPMIEKATRGMEHLTNKQKYTIHLLAYPGFITFLTPERFIIRTHEGITYSITDFKIDSTGWYSAQFSP